MVDGSERDATPAELGGDLNTLREAIQVPYATNPADCAAASRLFPRSNHGHLFTASARCRPRSRSTSARISPPQWRQVSSLAVFATYLLWPDPLRLALLFTPPPPSALCALLSSALCPLVSRRWSPVSTLLSRPPHGFRTSPSCSATHPHSNYCCLSDRPTTSSQLHTRARA